jgi:hypothetical protein
MRICEERHRLGLANETPPELGIGAECDIKDLQGHDVAAPVVCSIHDTRRAATQLRLEHVTTDGLVHHPPLTASGADPATRLRSPPDVAPPDELVPRTEQ